MKRLKRYSQAWYRKKCVVWAKTEAKRLAGYKCEHCGRSKEQGWQMHGSHIYPEGTYISMSADVDNILCLCAQCHTGGIGGVHGRSKTPSWHGDPVYFGDWFATNYPKRKEVLKKRAQEIKVINWEERYYSLPKNKDVIEYNR